MDSRFRGNDDRQVSALDFGASRLRTGRPERGSVQLFTAVDFSGPGATQYQLCATSPAGRYNKRLPSQSAQP